MAVIRLILLVAILGGLTLLLAQNWSPVLSLAFLGMRSQPLPLAIWILFSTAAGVVTSLFITGLFQLSNYFAGGQRKIPSQSRKTSARPNPPRREEPSRQAATPPPPASKTESSASDKFDDWDSSSSTDDWDFEEKYQEAPASSSHSTEVKDSPNYERQQEPKSGYKSGSVYSYSYREPKNSGVGKTESIYDADYRVIVPPYQPPTKNQTDNQDDDDDWGFFDDDDFENKDERPRR